MFDLFSGSGKPVIGAARNPPDGPDWHAMDVSDPKSIRALADHLTAVPIELLICNAGIFPDKGQLLDTGFPPAMWDTVFRTNVTGTFLTVQALLPNLRAAHRPRIALLASRLGSSELASGDRYIYRASKAAVINLGRNLAVDLRGDGIAVGIYHPGWVRTDMGGPSGDIDVETSVKGLATRFEELGPKTSGRFQNWDGQTLPF